MQKDLSGYIYVSGNEAPDPSPSSKKFRWHVKKHITEAQANGATDMAQRPGVLAVAHAVTPKSAKLFTMAKLNNVPQVRMCSNKVLSLRLDNQELPSATTDFEESLWDIIRPGPWTNSVAALPRCVLTGYARKKRPIYAIHRAKARRDED
ncbi:Hermansky-Pudlak syndrome 5 protein [Echinococcus multilocularis]|uniref:Hermansky-Pudlak syndrome 5 protein n=1 Tax=Echinococcus multilocularis TaxID=6211 RepID=A0A0S4MIM9_ECHMU|nr:Hermansky-Pudlak syndrome 5 protein [Echinococcus multilocularis]